MPEGVRGRPFVKGQSGNPLGRPRSGEALGEKIRHMNGEDGKVIVEFLQAVITDHGSIRERIRDILAGDPATHEEELYKHAVTCKPNLQQMIIAAGTLLDRGYGRPPQTIELTTPDGDVTSWTPDQLSARAAAIMEQLKGGVLVGAAMTSVS